jgi:molybdopterin-containing oxidoreductase family iron-sulfur binding subunit
MSDLVQLKSSLHKPGSSATEGQATRSCDDTQSSPAPRLETLRKELSSKSGKEYWRSIEELTDSKEFQELMHREFPENASEWDDPVGRRKFLKLMGASLALAGFTACTRQPTEYIAPYVRQPEEIILGKPLYFATATTLNGVATGVLVESHEGRPTKVEGNPDHPASLGATDLYSQASILSLYDPDRSQTLTYLGDVTTWSNFLAAARALLLSLKAGAQPAPQSQPQQGAQPPQGAQPLQGGLRILTETITSPSLAYHIQTLVNTTPNTKWHVYEPAGNDNAREGARLAFGSYATAVYDFSKAEVIVSLDSDFLACGPASLRYSRDFSARRRLEHGKQTTSRLYVVESSVSSTGSVADNRLPMRPTEIENFARALAAGFGSSVQQGNLSDAHRRWVGAIVKDLNAHRGTSLVIAGDSQPPFIHALAYSINQQLGNVGQTVTFVEPVEGNPVAGTASLQELMGDINAGTVNTLLILGGNPVYTAPADFNFAEAMKKVPLRIHLGLYQDETSELCHWHIPEAHYLESWGDARAYNGLVSIIQPLIAPIYSGKTAHEVVAAFSDQGAGQTGYQLIQDYWRRFFEGGRREPAPPAAARTTQAAAAAQSQIASSQSGGAAASQPQPATGAQPAAATNAQSTTGGSAPAGGTANTEFDRFWRRALHDGFIAGTERQPKTASVGAIQAPPLVTSSADAIEIVFRPDPTIYDGRFANNGWLQELPKPITTLVWDNAAIMSPATAARLNLGSVSGGMSTNRVGSIGGEFFADMIELTIDGRSQAFPAWIQPGHPNDTVTVHLGYGRRRAGRVGLGLGFNAYAIRSSGAQWSAR